MLASMQNLMTVSLMKWYMHYHFESSL